MKKVISIVFIAVTLFMLTSCASGTYGDIEGTLVEKYQESYKGSVYNYFRLQFDEYDEILLFKVDDDIYISYSKNDKVPMTEYKDYDINGCLISVRYEFKAPKKR